VELGGLPVEADVSGGVWISSGRRRGEPGTVGALVPAVFEAYARVLHPAVRYVGDDDVEVSWAEVAAHNGTTAHPLMQWASITGSWDFVSADSQSPVWDAAPSEGHLTVLVAARLAGVLAATPARRPSASSAAGTASATTCPRPTSRPGSSCAVATTWSWCGAP
jgi:hypothetical protein